MVTWQLVQAWYLAALFVCRTDGLLHRERMALQAQQVDLAHPQKARIGRTVHRVATAAAFGFYGDVFVGERAALVGVAFEAHRIASRQSPHLPNCRRAVDIVAVTALHQTFIHTMVIGLCEISFGRGVAPIAEIRLGLHEQKLPFGRVVRRVAIHATHVIAGVCRAGKVSLFVFLAMATETAGIGFLPRQFFETHDLGDIAASDVCGSGSMTRFAAVTVA
jgi:hypothetical protein